MSEASIFCAGREIRTGRGRKTGVSRGGFFKPRGLKAQAQQRRAVSVLTASARKLSIAQPTYMIWQLLDRIFWQTLIPIIAIIAAYIVGRRQIKIQDIVELYCSYGLIVNKDSDEKTMSSIPIIHVQNVGTRLIYLDKYIFNGREYDASSQILPSTYSQAENNFYRIELPPNEEKYVSLEIFYHDLDSRSWSSRAIATKGGLGWDIKTLPRKSRK